jgi:hypothetical protein
MRASEEIRKLIVEIACGDERIRAVLVNVSRANKSGNDINSRKSQSREPHLASKHL